MKKRDPLDDMLKAYFHQEVADTGVPARPDDPNNALPVHSHPADGVLTFNHRPSSNALGRRADAGGGDSLNPAPKSTIVDAWAKVLIAAAAALLIFLPLRGADLAGASARQFAEFHRTVDTGAVISSGLLSAQRVLSARFAGNGSADHTN